MKKQLLWMFIAMLFGSLPQVLAGVLYADDFDRSGSATLGTTSAGGESWVDTPTGGTTANRPWVSAIEDDSLKLDGAKGTGSVYVDYAMDGITNYTVDVDLRVTEEGSAWGANYMLFAPVGNTTMTSSGYGFRKSGVDGVGTGTVDVLWDNGSSASTIASGLFNTNDVVHLKATVSGTASTLVITRGAETLLEDSARVNNTTTGKVVGMSTGWAIVSYLDDLTVEQIPELPPTTIYYVDAAGGSDAADGLSELSAWQSLSRVNQMTFGPGDEVLFKAGGRWVGQLKLKGSGSEENEIRVGRYGEGARPCLAGEAVPNTTVELDNGQHWIIEDLEITNQSADGSRRDKMVGIEVNADAGGDFKNITLRRLHVHHVSGGWDRQGGKGIYVGSAGGSRYDGLLIEDCFIHDVSFYGILVSGWENRYRDERWFPHQNVVVRNNFTRDTGGDSIVVISCENPLIEHNEAHRCAIGQANGGSTHAAGMWPHSSDGTVMRYNKVKDIDASKDGQAFDVDINCRNTLIEYNWSERNTSGFLLLCSPNDEVPGTSNVVVRNNLSIDDGANKGLITFVSDVVDVTIENNAFVNSNTGILDFMHTWQHPETLGWITDVLFTKNIFSTPGGFDYEGVSWVVPTFENNTYAGTYNNFPADATGTQTNAPAVQNDGGVVSAAYEGSTFQSFDVSSAGLLPTNPWFNERVPPPNVIIIYADDLGYGDLGCYGCEDIPTPHIDQLAVEGVRFTDGYVSAPQCAPSRVGVLSGKYQNRLGFEYNPPASLVFSHGFPRTEPTIGDLMQAQGYKTGIIGKWHMGAGPDLHPNQRGFDEFFGTLFGHSNYLPPFDEMSKSYPAYNLPDSDIQRNGVEVNEQEYLTDAFTREAVAFIDQYHNEPFFLYLPYTAPHGPLEASQEYLNRFPDIADSKRQTYAAMVSALDDGVGAIMDKLAERNLAENTVVFFISDNGATRNSSYGDNGPLRAWKGSLYEGGIRIPYIMSWKGTLPAGVVDERPVIQLDATATALELAGGDASEMDGVNLIPYLLTQTNDVPHEQLFWRMMSWSYPTTGEPYQKATRRGDWKLVQTKSDFELYNLKTDISEQTNLAAANPELVEELKASWNEWEQTVEFPHFPDDSETFPWEELRIEAETNGYRTGSDHPALMLRLEASNYEPVYGTWPDTSGLNNHATQTNDSNRPALIEGQTTNGASVVRFDGGDHLDLTVGISALSPEDGYTAFVYLRPEVADNPQTIFGGLTGSCQYRLNANETQHLLATWTGGTGGPGSTILPTGTSSGFSLISAQINSEGGALRLNGSLDGTLKATTFAAPIISIGRNGQSGSEHFSGDIVEIRIYNRQLTETEVAVVEAELDAAYGTGVLKVAPVLSVAFTGSNVVLSWMPADSGWVLQESDNLLSNWVDCVGGSLNPATNPVDGTTLFYRLRGE